MHNHTNLDLRELFKGNWNRFEALESNLDLRARFEALYNCFENVGQLTTGKLNGGMIDGLKENKETNILRENFISLEKVSFYMKNHIKNRYNKSLLFYLIELRKLSPIYNNTRDQMVFITKEKPFETFLDALYVVRNNVRHGTKEYTDRSDQILFLMTQILIILLQETHDTLFKREIVSKITKNEGYLVVVKKVFFIIAIFTVIPFLAFVSSFFDGEQKQLITIDCSGEAQYSDVCNPPIQDDREQYDSYRGR